MDNTVYVKTYIPHKINKKEVMRYAGVRENIKEIEEVLTCCIKEIEDKLTYKVCYREFEISHKKDCIDFGFYKALSEDLKKNLEGCSKIILFGATIGLEVDRLIAKYNRISPVKALMFQAIGAERIEALCDEFNGEIKEKYFTSPRFSPGYGDLNLEFQKEIFKVLTPQKYIGLTLNESLLMSPSKSVTAIIGVKDSECVDIEKGCESCNKKDCEFRRI